MFRIRSAAVYIVAFAAAAGCSPPSTHVVTAPASTTAPGAATQSKPPAVPSSSPAPKKAAVGTAVDLKGRRSGEAIQVTLVRIVDPAEGKDFYKPDAGNRFVAVQFRIVNTGSAAYSDTPEIEAKVKDAAGESFNPTFADTTAGVSMDSGLALAPGDTALGFVTFEVPAGVKPTVVQYSMNPFFGDVAQWSVG